MEQDLYLFGDFMAKGFKYKRLVVSFSRSKVGKWSHTVGRDFKVEYFLAIYRFYKKDKEQKHYSILIGPLLINIGILRKEKEHGNV